MAPALSKRLKAESLSEDFSRSVRRRLADRLEQEGLWIAKEECRAFLHERRTFGHALQERVLLPALGTIDYAYLNSESAFGLPRFGMRSRLPLMLSFGYDVGSGMHSYLRGHHEQHESIARLCALFNLGISVYDRTCDEVKDGAEHLSSRLDERRLHRLISDPSAPVELATAARTATGPEMRTLLNIVGAVYSALHDAGGASRGGSLWKELESLLLAAYRAETSATTRRAAAYPEDLRDVVEKKSTAPFEIMLQMVRVCDEAAASNCDSEASQLTHCIGRVFSLIDDLVDIATDLERGTMNGILLRASGGSAYGRADDRLARRLIEEDWIDRSIHCASDDLAAVVRSLEGPECAARLRQVILGYVRSWGD